MMMGLCVFDILFWSQTHRNSRAHGIQSLPKEAENHARNSQQSGEEQASTEDCCFRRKTELQLSPNRSQIKLSRHKSTNQPPFSALRKRNGNHTEERKNKERKDAHKKPPLCLFLPSQRETKTRKGF
ncbi:hypothetical protein GQ457_17G016150 [Hibiscus cannabinus]